MKKIFLLCCICLVTLTGIARQYERYGGVYFAYPETQHACTQAPEGYKPFYICMFTRHGSRWLPEDKRYTDVNAQFADTSNLTPLGKDVRRRLLAIYEDARGRGGDLTDKGAQQMRGLAERMAGNFPAVFSKGADVDARSSVSGRCMMSMNAFLVGLAQARPDLHITARANRRDMDYIAFTTPEEHELEAKTQNQWRINPDRLMKTLFIHPERVKDARSLASELHTIASDMQNVNTGQNLYDLFTEDEMKGIYEMNNERMELCNGINDKNEGVPQRCAERLWRHIENCADSAIATGRPSASLLFGHDTSLYRLLSLLGLFKDENRMDRIIPMGANLQMVFYKSPRNKDVLVKLLHNESEVLLPVQSKGITPPYYRWTDVKTMVDRSPELNLKRVAFISDAHIDDVETHPRWMRSMDSEIHSTRLFNENIFAFRAALDDVARRGIRLVVLPGDITDNGQIGNIHAVRRILNEYAKRYGIRFFTTTGNHDPSKPFGEEAVEDTYLNDDGSPLFIASKDGLLPAGCKGIVDTLRRRCGYKEIMAEYKDFGMSPQPSDLFWSTPFARYTYRQYAYDKAVEAGKVENRTYILGDSLKAIDASYLVEPVKGLWLLAIDGGVYFPEKKVNGVQTYKGAQLGYNNVEKGKAFLLPWIARVVKEAGRLGKTLVAFCHYPAVDFNSGTTPLVKKWWGKDKFNIPRAPSAAFSRKLADTGLTLHFAGHMHMNNTATVTGTKGNVLYNFQVPSTALCIPAYKILTLKSQKQFRVNTVALDSVPGFNSLFDRYQAERTYESAHGGSSWDASLITSRSYPEFCSRHFLNLLRVRLLPEEMPVEVRDTLMATPAARLLSLAGCELAGTDTTWTGNDLVTDMYKIRYAGDLALKHIPLSRLDAYGILFKKMSAMKPQTDSLKENLRRICLVFDCFLSKLKPE